MTFQELMDKYKTLIEGAAYETDGLRTPKTELLEKALEAELAPFLPEEKLKVAARMAAKDLVSRYQIPESFGATFEGGMNGVGSDNPDIEFGADQPAPEPVKVVVLPREKKS